jgi:hypothetical protein
MLASLRIFVVSLIILKKVSGDNIKVECNHLVNPYPVTIHELHIITRDASTNREPNLDSTDVFTPWQPILLRLTNV